MLLPALVLPSSLKLSSSDCDESGYSMSGGGGTSSSSPTESTFFSNNNSITQPSSMSSLNRIMINNFSSDFIRNSKLLKFKSDDLNPNSLYNFNESFNTRGQEIQSFKQ